MKKLLLLLLFFSQVAMSQPLRLAVYQYADNPRIKNLQPLADHIQQRLGVATTVTSYPTVHLFIEGIQKGEVDIAFINTFGYLLLEASDKPYPMTPQIALTVPNPDDNYKTAFIARATAPVNEWKDLLTTSRQLRLGLVALGSTSGNLVPRLALTRLGINQAEKQFKTVIYTGTHARAIQALLNDEADLAAMGSSEYSKLDKETQKQLKPVWLSTEIPLGPVLFSKRMDKQLEQQVIQLLLQSHTKAPAVLEAIKAAWSEAQQATHFEKITDTHYTPFLQQFGPLSSLQPILKQFAN